MMATDRHGRVKGLRIVLMLLTAATVIGGCGGGGSGSTGGLVLDTNQASGIQAIPVGEKVTFWLNGAGPGLKRSRY